MPWNWRSGVWQSHIRRSIILQKLSTRSANAAHPRFSTISWRHRISRAADCVTYTMSDSSENPSSFRFETYAWSSTFTFALGSSTVSLIGIGTRSISRASSPFSSSRTEMFAKSFDSAKRRSTSMSDSVGLRKSLYTATVEWLT